MMCCYSSNGVKSGCCLLVFLTFLIHSAVANGAEPGYARAPVNGVCPSLDIKSSPDEIEPWRDCEVIEGVLQITSMERTELNDFRNFSFNKLREITGHLIIYRLAGIKTLGSILPKLSVIRGQKLFRDYAFIVFQLGDLETIGLKSLTSIERGSVRIEQNKRLCYVNTIDWNVIAPSNILSNYIMGNKEQALCGMCPGEVSSLNLGPCPRDSKTNTPLCWDENTCQHVCPEACETNTCMSNGTCCAHNCLGGCDGPRPTDCHVCRHISLGYGENRRCVKDCPAALYKHYKRRCITESECKEQFAPKIFEVEMKLTSYKPINGTCMYDCPFNFNEERIGSNLTCVPCSGTCKKDCPGTRVDSLAKAESLRGCTHINGNLEIMIKGGTNVVRDLADFLGYIEYIEGALKVTRSFAITTLYFLKSLKRIEGNPALLGDNAENYTLHIFDNPNMEKLWDWPSHGPIKIEHGKIFVHYNPKLCYQEILPLKSMTPEPFDDYQVSPLSNGDRTVCDNAVLNLYVESTSFSSATLRFNNYCVVDYRDLLGYSIYYIKAPKNITIYDGRDACYDAWSVEDRPVVTLAKIDIFDPVGTCEKQQPEFQFLTRLEPFTRYAVYIKTFTTLKDKKGAQSPIIYFTTKPGQPEAPSATHIVSPSPHELTIVWKKPDKPNGILTEYVLKLELDPTVEKVANENAYCSSVGDLITGHRTKSRTQSTAFTTAPTLFDDNSETNECKCAANLDRDSSHFNEDKQSLAREATVFENELQDKIFIRLQPLEPKRFYKQRRALADGLDQLGKQIKNKQMVPFNESDIVDEDGYLTKTVLIRPANVTKVTVKGLRNYGHYKIYIWACRAPDPPNDLPDRCSKNAYEDVYTLPLTSADVVENVRAELESAGNKTIPEVKVTWQEPKKPNGPLAAYKIRHIAVHTDGKDSRAPIVCITHSEYLNNSRSYILRNLAPGNYSVSVMAVTMAGVGNWSKSATVIIPELSGNGEWIGGVIAGVTAALIAITLAAWWLKKSSRTNDHNRLFASVNPEYIATQYQPDEWEIERENIKTIRELGQGTFGMVYEGLAKGIKGEGEIHCAIKTVNEHATDRERVDFLKEASTMKAFDTAHVVRLLGVVSRGQPTLVVMELMMLGDLKSFLRARRQEDEEPSTLPQPTLAQIRQMAIEIADGMSYLSAKKFVHRDLAARNCMVAEDYTVKVGDFGMTRDVYETDYYRKGSKGLLPVRWMSPESLKDGVFSCSSDVWSYGVVLWEMATLAMQPYQGLSNEQVLRYVVEGGVMECPNHCPEGLYDLMRWCWKHKPDERPAFLQIVAELAPHAKPKFRQRSFFHTIQGRELYAQYSSSEGAGDQMDDGDVGNGGAGSRLASWVRSVTRSHTPEPEQLALVLKPQTNGLRRSAEPC